MKRYSLPGPKAKAILERDLKVIVQANARVSYPFVMDHGKGCELWDVDGNKFIDFAAGIAVNSTGHCHPKVVKAVQKQAEDFIHISSDFYHEKWVELAEYLDRIAPFKEPAVSFMTNSGTESVEAAIKLARYHTGRTQYIAFLGAFHGRTMGSVSFTASKAHYHRGFFPLLSSVTHIPYPNPYRPLIQPRAGEDYGTAIIRYLKEEIFERLIPAQEVAAILVEPIQGEGGYVVPPSSFFPALREICDQNGILLIADEVQAGVGRTGKWWSIEHFGVEPDMITVAKGIASGVPMGAMVCRKSVSTWKPGAHGNTYGGNPLACVAALETLKLIEEEYMQNAIEVGEYAMTCLRQMMDRQENIGEVRGKGLMIGIELVEDRETKKPASSLRNTVVDLAFELGLVVMGCGASTLRLCPPLCITRKEMDQGLAIIDEAITLAKKGVKPGFAA